MNKFLKRIIAYGRLIRLDKPVPFFLILWPAWWGIFLSAKKIPETKYIVIFMLGAWVMRAAGCVINDMVDRKFDSKVARTRSRPLASAQMNMAEAWIILFILLLMALFLVLQLNFLTIVLACIGLLLTCIYPWLKRITYFPQVLLGIIFAGFPMLLGFAAIQNEINTTAIWAFNIASLWPFAYDTVYALQDYEDDMKLGLKSTAIWLHPNALDYFIFMMTSFLLMFAALAFYLKLAFWFYLGWLAAVIIFIQQIFLIRQRTNEAYHKAFLICFWQGLALFLGILFSKI